MLTGVYRMRKSTDSVMRDSEITIHPIDEDVDHVRGSSSGRPILEYGDYECPYSRRAFREIERVERDLGDGVGFAFRHFPLTEIHPHALAASAAAEAAALQGRFWEMHELLFHHQKALGDDDLRGYAAELGLDLGRFDGDLTSAGVIARIRRDIDSGEASGEVRARPLCSLTASCTRGPYDAASLLEALAE
jgi:protein-disulfide isomerase